MAKLKLILTNYFGSISKKKKKTKEASITLIPKPSRHYSKTTGHIAKKTLIKNNTMTTKKPNMGLAQMPSQTPRV